VNELRILALPLAVAALAVVVLLVDVLAPQRRGSDATQAAEARARGKALGWFVAAAFAGLFVATFYLDGSGRAAHGAYEGGAWTTSLQRLFFVAGALGALGSLDDVAARTPRRAGEYWMLFVFSLAGMVLLAGARDLVLLVVSFELMSIPLYVLAAFAKTDATPEEPKGRASEAAIKLYLVGATSTAVTMFGLALLTGMAGTTRLDTIGAVPLVPLSAVGLLMVLGGLGYKIGMAPFHMWVPDTYQGASTPFVAFLSVAPKAAGVAALAQIFLFGFGHARSQWLMPLAMAALLSMTIGNLLALPQTDLRRLLGYSGIAQMGYVLVGLATDDAFGVGMVLFFLTAYVVTNMGAFLVVHVAAEAGGGHDFATLAGLSKRSPGLAAALLVFLLSLAGIPFVVGFWAKLYVLLAAWRAGLPALVVAGIVLAVMGLFYYLRVLRAAYMVGGDLPTPKLGAAMRIAIASCALAVVGLGLWPEPLVADSMRAASALMSPRPSAPHETVAAK
jgi:NADH-quinone oxidoreductase subunit N